MQIRSLELKNFRCFPALRQTFDGQLTLIQGCNGSGKTSLLEALYYGCYVKSFRTHKSGEVARSGGQAFFLKIVLEEQDGQEHTITVGFDQGKKEVKVDGKVVESYKELVNLYRVVAITEDDLLLIKGEPEIRRTFLDQVLLTQNPAYSLRVSSYRALLKQRNALLSAPANPDPRVLELWTEKLWTLAEEIRKERRSTLADLAREANALIAAHFDELGELAVTYCLSEENLLGEHNGVSTPGAWLRTFTERERIARRTLFGPHLDDIAFELKRAGGILPCKQYASRGQQKLLAVILKLAHLALVGKNGAIVVLDDFMTDFDPQRAQVLLGLLKNYQTHLFFTSPLGKEQVGYLFDKGFEKILLKKV